MTLDEIKGLLAEADPGIRHYFSMGTGEAYTYWEETRNITLPGNNSVRINSGWRFYVHRFTKAENDETAGTIFQKLDEDPRTTVTWTVGYETETGYIHHIFECEGV